MRLHGVGEKIANCALLFGAGRWEAFPIDVWIERILRQLYRKRVKGAKLHAWAGRHFGPHAGYAQQYLFHFARKTL
jgi:N-glycosylase/DNA lyase